MTQYGTWKPYADSDAFLLAIVLLIIAGVLAYLGTRLKRSIQLQGPGTTDGILLVVIWVLSLLSLGLPASFITRRKPSNLELSRCQPTRLARLPTYLD